MVLPNDLAGSTKIIDFLAGEISIETAINVMDQYRPCYKALSNKKISRRPSREEIESVEQYALKKGLRVIN